MIFSVDYAGENFVRFTGDTINHAKVQLFAWEAHEKGVDVHPLGEPTKLEILRKQYDEKKDEFKKKGQLDILEKYVKTFILTFGINKYLVIIKMLQINDLFLLFLRYGGEEHLNVPPKDLLLAQTEHYAEYTRHGTIIKVLFLLTNIGILLSVKLQGLLRHFSFITLYSHNFYDFFFCSNFENRRKTKYKKYFMYFFLTISFSYFAKVKT